MGDPHRTVHAPERAALHALGCFDDEETRELEHHLREGCSECRAEVEAFAATAADLACAAGALDPPAELRSNLFQRVLGRSPLASAPVLEKDGLHFIRTAGLSTPAWTAGGIEVHSLSVDRSRGYRTSLIRMQPGTELPVHRHAGVEESFILEGTLLVSGVSMGPGDYCRADPGTIHRNLFSPDGCVFIAVSSERDEILAE